MTDVVDMLDAIGANAGAIPAGTKKVAIYLTGSGGIQWTNADVEKLTHDDPELELVLRIDQANQSTNIFHNVKYLVVDIEPGAANIPDAIRIAAGRKRLGLRTCLYHFEAEAEPVRAAVSANGLNDMVDYWLAHWGIGRAAAVNLLGTAGIKAVQYENDASVDRSVTLADWPNAPAPPPAPKRSQALLTAVEEGAGAAWQVHGVDAAGDVAIDQDDAVAVKYVKGVWSVAPLAHPAPPKSRVMGLSVNVHPKVAAAGVTSAALAGIRAALAAFGVHVPVTPEEQAAVLAAVPLVVAWFKSSGLEVK